MDKEPQEQYDERGIVEKHTDIKHGDKKKGKTERKKDIGPAILQLKITLDQSSPKVWRRILIPPESTFFDLHVAIQDAMGWTDSHLHAFCIAQKGTARSLAIQFPNPDNDWLDDDDLDERIIKISDYLGIAVKQCKYCYDFGDSWDHTILLEREVPRDENDKYPHCIAGANACPPDDCGGVWGYQNLQRILKNPKHAEHADMLDWLCIDNASDFDPSEFNPADVQFENTSRRLKEYEKGFGIAPFSKQKKS